MLVMSGSSNSELRASIHTKLIQSGEKEKLKEHLRQRLVECEFQGRCVQIMSCSFVWTCYPGIFPTPGFHTR